ncbi:MAG TPA: sulfur carrier protein ThiS [Usitatibacteraceae bacterium]|nr:sulfur carrier protein ThiS [Usitatibacteraceae bacterium]
MLQLTINGESKLLPESSRVVDALRLFSVDGKRFAVELNGEIVPKGRHAATPLKNGDKVEIVIAVGGG